MARRRRGVGDDIGKFVSDIMSPWLGSSPATPPQVVRAEEVVKTLVETADLVTGGYGRAAMAGPTELAKQAAINLALGGAGYGVGRAAQAAVMSGRVVNPVAAVRNLVRGEKVVVHGSPLTRLSEIQPSFSGYTRGAPNRQLPEQNVMFGWDPRKPGMAEKITRSARSYASKEAGEGVAPGSIYVARIQKSEITTPTELMKRGMVISRGSGKVVSEIPVAGKTAPQLDAQLKQSLRLAGAPAKPRVSRTAAAVEKTKTKVRQTFMTRAQKDALERRRQSLRIR